MDSQKKEVYQATAEVLGLCLKHFANQDHQIVVLNIVRDQLQKLKKLAGARSQEKFMNCLYMVFQHFPDIVEQFASTFVYDMAHVPKGVCLKQAVEMLQGALPYFRYLSLNCNITVCNCSFSGWGQFLQRHTFLRQSDRNSDILQLF